MMIEQKCKIEKFIGVKGMNDIFLQDVGLWEFFEVIVKLLLCVYGYQNICMLIVEYMQFFMCGIGEVIDIVEKEMYSFIDVLNGENLMMCLENIVVVVCVLIEYNMLYDGLKCLWYIGLMFCYECLQCGCYCQFYQVGVEVFGFVGFDVDVEIIMMCQCLWDDFGLIGIKFEINLFGFVEECVVYCVELIKYFEQFVDVFDEDVKCCLYMNLLCVFDMKNLVLQDIVQNVLKLIDFFGDELCVYFEGLQCLLFVNNILFKINLCFVCGFDYYNLIVFEWVIDKFGVQGMVVVGGCYDLLIEQFGGKLIVVCGWVMGIECIFELLKEEDFVFEQEGVDVYVVYQGEIVCEQVFIVVECLCDMGFDVIFYCSVDGVLVSFKLQMKWVDVSGVVFVVIFGEEEVVNGMVGVKVLCGVGVEGEKNVQQIVLVESLIEFLINVMVVFVEDGDD